jgi:hypothetical protein
MTFVDGPEIGTITVTNNNAFTVKVYDGEPLSENLKGDLAPDSLPTTFIFASWKISIQLGGCIYCYSSSSPYESVPCEGTTTTTCAPFSSFVQVNNENWPTSVTITNFGPTPIDLYDGPTFIETVSGGDVSSNFIPLVSNVLTVYNGTCQYCFDATVDLFPEVSCNTTTTTTEV